MRGVEKELQRAVKLAADLLEELSLDGNWGKEEEIKLKKLTKIAALLGKLSAIDYAEEPEESSVEKDREIIQRFIQRFIKNEKPDYQPDIT